MRLLKNKSKQKIALMIILGFIISSTPFTYLFFRSNFPKVANTNTEKATLNPQGIVEDFYSVQWLDNPTFESPVDPWYNSTFGDTSDLIASIGTNQANYEVLGDEHTEQIQLIQTGNHSINRNWLWYLRETASHIMELIVMEHGVVIGGMKEKVVVNQRTPQKCIGRLM